VQSSTSYHILLVDFGELLMKLYAIKVASGYQIWLALLVVSQSCTLALSTPSWTRIWYFVQNGIHLEGIMGSTTLGSLGHPNANNNCIWCYLACLSCQRATSWKRNQMALTSRFFKTMNVNRTWSNHWYCPNAKSLFLTTPQIIDLPLNSLVVDYPNS
jgi:hypothetical protein